MAKKSREKCKYLEKERVFKVLSASLNEGKSLGNNSMVNLVKILLHD